MHRFSMIFFVCLVACHSPAMPSDNNEDLSVFADGGTADMSHPDLQVPPDLAVMPFGAWDKNFPTSDDYVDSHVATDAMGNIIVAGTYIGNPDFGGGPLGQATQQEIYVAKFTAAGGHVWSRRFGALDDYERVTGVAVDGSGNIAVCGAFHKSFDFGGGPLPHSFILDIFLVKLSPSGAHLWSKGFGNGGNNDDANGVAFDSSGNVVLVGSISDPVDFGGGPVPDPPNTGVFLAKFAPDGKHLFSKAFSSDKVHFAWGVAVDKVGNIAMTGSCTYGLDFGGGIVCKGSADDAFLARFSPSGVHLWSKSLGGLYDDEGRSVAFDSAGNVLITGRFSKTADFGGGPITAASDQDIFLAKYGPDGGHLWSKGFVGDSEIAFRVAIDSLDNAVLIGRFKYEINFGGGKILSQNDDAFVAKFSPMGGHLWSHRLGGMSYDDGRDLAIDPSGNIFAVGSFRDTVDFGNGPLTASSSGDLFIIKRTP